MRGGSSFFGEGKYPQKLPNMYDKSRTHQKTVDVQQLIFASTNRKNPQQQKIGCLTGTSGVSCVCVCFSCFSFFVNWDHKISSTKSDVRL